MEEYKLSNIDKYLSTNEQDKFATHPSKIVSIESFRRLCRHWAASNERILDIGGGAGIWTKLMREEGIQVETWAVDISSSILKEREQQDIAVVGDIEHLPFKNESFDRAFFFSSLHHVKHTQRALEEALRVVKLRGRLIISEPVSLRLFLLRQDIQPVGHSEFCFSSAYIFRLLKTLGLEIHSIYYHGVFRRMMPSKPNIALYRICDRLDHVLNNVPLLKHLGVFGSKVTIVAQKRYCHVNNAN